MRRWFGARVRGASGGGLGRTAGGAAQEAGQQAARALRGLERSSGCGWLALVTRTAGAAASSGSQRGGSR
jgi:hypothetical protein